MRLSSSRLTPTAVTHGGPSGAKAPLLGRQLPDQLPELGEGQLAVVVLIQGAHQLLDRPGVAGVLDIVGQLRGHQLVELLLAQGAGRAVLPGFLVEGK